MRHYRSVYDSTVMNNSEIFGVMINGSYSSNSTTEDGTYLNNAKIYSGTKVSGTGRITGVTVTSSTIKGSAYITTPKTGKTCDGIDDNLPCDPCNDLICPNDNL